MSSGLRRTWGQRAVLTINVFGIVAALAVAWTLRAGDEVASSINRVELSGSLTPAEPDDDGERSSFNVLLVGYDSAANLDPDDPVAIGRQGERLGDVIIIARIDQTTETATLLSIPRDLWVPIPGFEDNKINAAFQLGGPGLLVDTIEEHLGIPINNYVSVDLAGFEGLVDVVDHVDLYFEHPSRDFNPSPPSGPPRSMSGFAMPETACQALSPDMALAFVRSRNYQINVDGEWIDDGQRSDLERIRRQQIFLESFVARAIDLGARNPLVLAELVSAAVPNLTLDQDLTPQTLIDLGRTFDSFDAEELDSFSLPTEFGFERDRTVSVVRTLDDEAAPLLRLMLGDAPDEPRTVGIDLRAVSSRSDEADDLFGALESAGFDIESPVTVSEAPQGVVVRYGRDGDDAVAIVVNALTEFGVSVDLIEPDDSLPGREISVLLGPSVDSLGEPALDPPNGASTTVPTDDQSDVTTVTPTVPTEQVGASTSSTPSVRACP